MLPTLDRCAYPLPQLVLRESARLRYVTFFYLYVMQGIPAGFGLTAVYNYLIGAGLTAKAVGTFAAIVGLLPVVLILML